MGAALVVNFKTYQTRVGGQCLITLLMCIYTHRAGDRHAIGVSMYSYSEMIWLGSWLNFLCGWG